MQIKKRKKEEKSRVKDTKEPTKINENNKEKRKKERNNNTTLSLGQIKHLIHIFI